MCTSVGDSVDAELQRLLLGEEHVAHLADDLAYSSTLQMLGNTLVKDGRVQLLRLLKSFGVMKLHDRQAVANILTRSVRQGAITQAGCVPADFAVQGERMPYVVRRLLVHGDQPSSVHVQELLDSLKIARRVCPELADATGCDVLRAPKVITQEGCAALRRAVDIERSTAKDSVDRAAEHQRNVTAIELGQLIGVEVVQRLWQLPIEFHIGQIFQRVEHFRVEAFIRRYSIDTRPWNGFHKDSAAVTVNVALADDVAHGGGRLLAVFDGAVQHILRHEGEATVHTSTLLHAVTSMTWGVRYSLILFFHHVGPGASKDADDSTTPST